MTTISADLLAAERTAKAEYAAAHNAHGQATDRLDEARRVLNKAKNDLDDWFEHATGRKVT